MKKKLTDAQGVEAVSTQIAGYERQKLEEQFAERLYTIWQTAYERAREDLLRHQLYLITVVTPTPPEDPTYSRIVGSTLLVFGAFLVVWSVVVLIVATIEEHILRGPSRASPASRHFAMWSRTTKPMPVRRLQRSSDGPTMMNHSSQRRG